MQYKVTFHVPAEITVTLSADNENDAADSAWQYAEDFLEAVYGNSRGVSFHASLDGIGADDVVTLDKEEQ